MTKKKKEGKVKVGIVGCGNISGIYFDRMKTKFDILEVAACADLVPEKAKLGSSVASARSC